MQLLPDERIIIEARAHKLILIVPIIVTLVFLALFVAGFAVLFLNVIPNPMLFVSGVMVGSAAAASAITKIVTDWYYHLYSITTRRIIEHTSNPLFSERINEVLLDQVRIIEVDINMSGIVEDLLNIGDVIVAFDRPSHQETFVMSHIENPAEVGEVLAKAFETMMHEVPIWFQRGYKTNPLQFADDIYA